MRKINFKILILLCLAVLNLGTTYSMKKNKSKHVRKKSSLSKLKDDILKRLKTEKKEKKSFHFRKKTSSWPDFIERCGIVDKILDVNGTKAFLDGEDIVPYEDDKKGKRKKDVAKERNKAINIILKKAIIRGNLQKFIDLLGWAPENVSDIINEKTEPNGDSFLHVATRHNHAEIVKYLLEKNIDINIVSNKGKIAYQIACENNNHQIQCLIFKKFITYRGLLDEKTSNLYFVKSINNEGGKQKK